MYVVVAKKFYARAQEFWILTMDRIGKTAARMCAKFEALDNKV